MQYVIIYSYCLISKSCPTLCNPMECSMPGSVSLTNSLNLPKFISIESVMPSNYLILCCPFSSPFQSFPASGSFQMSQLFPPGGQSIGALASASVLPMNVQDWFPLITTALISLLSKRLSSLLQHHSSKAWVLWHSTFFMVQLSHPHVTTRVGFHFLLQGIFPTQGSVSCLLCLLNWQLNFLLLSPLGSHKFEKQSYN